MAQPLWSVWSRFKTLDPWLIVLPLFLSLVGVAVIYSITVSNQGATLALRQLGYVAEGIVLYVIATFTDFRHWRTWSGLVYLASLITLILVRVVGTEEFGARRWIDFGFTRFQPSELAKLAVIVLLASWLYGRLNHIRNRRLLAALLLVAVPTILVLRQPDLGSAISIGITGVGMIMFAGLNRRQWIGGLIITLVGVFVVCAAWYRVAPFTGLLKEYQRERIETFLNPQADPNGAGYNTLQATIAIGSGGIMGRGLGFGSQSQLNFLPVSHTDFIFASLAESWGFVGSVLVVATLLILTYRITAAALLAKDDFSWLLCVGVAILFLLQVTINIGMNLSLLPVTGITLPLISYGGSSMVTMWLLLGMVQSVVVREKRVSFT